MKESRNSTDRGMNTLRSIARIMRSDSPLEKKLAQTAEILTGIIDEHGCCAAIEISGRTFVSRTFTEGRKSVDGSILVGGEEVGVVRLFTAATDVDPNGIETTVAMIADLVGVMVEHSHAHRTLQKWDHAVGTADWGFRMGSQDSLEAVKRRTKLLLQKEQQFLHALMDNVPDHIYFKDTESRIVRINKAHANWLGLRSPEDAVGKTDFDFFSEEHARQAYEDEQRLMATGKPMIGVTEKETWEDGDETWASTTKVPLIDSKGRVYGLVGISRRVERPESVRQSNEK